MGILTPFLPHFHIEIGQVPDVNLVHAEYLDLIALLLDAEKPILIGEKCLF